MKKHRFLSACLSLSLLTNTTNCFCVSKSEGKESDSTKTANIKKVVTSKPAKVIGGIGAGLLGAVGIYEGACHIGYKINVKKIQENMEQMKRLVSSERDEPFDFTQEKIASLPFETKLKIFEECFSIFVRENGNIDCINNVFYTLVQGVETILCRSAMKRLTSHEKRIIGLNGGNCLDFAFFASLVFDKLGIKNHIVCVKHKDGDCGFVNIFFDENEGVWAYFVKFRGANIDGCFCDIEDKNNKVVIEPLEKWDDKYLVDLNTIPLENFLAQKKKQSDDEIKFTGRLGDFTPSLFFI